MSTLGGLVRVASMAAALALAAAFVRPASARATSVSGTLTGSDGKPQADQQIHFEDLITRDIFLIQSSPKGDFSIDLPPGTYDLRAEHGAVLISGIAVNQTDVRLGKVREPSALNPARLFQGQRVDKGIVSTSAPSTANIPVVDEAAGSMSAPQPAAATATAAQASTGPAK